MDQSFRSMNPAAGTRWIRKRKEKLDCFQLFRQRLDVVMLCTLLKEQQQPPLFGERGRNKRFKKQKQSIHFRLNCPEGKRTKRKDGILKSSSFLFVCFLFCSSIFFPRPTQCVTIGVQVVGNVKSIYLSLDGGQEKEEKVNRISPSFEYVSHLSNHRLNRSMWNVEQEQRQRKEPNNRKKKMGQHHQKRVAQV